MSMIKGAISLIIVMTIFWVLATISLEYGLLFLALAGLVAVANPLLLNKKPVEQTTIQPPQARSKFTADGVVRTRLQMEAHLTQIQQRVAGLLLACEHLVDGDSPEQSLLYELYDSAHPGEPAEYDAQWVAELRESQQALQRIFVIRQSLLEPEVVAIRPIDELVRDWETLYVSMVGTQSNIIGLTEIELHNLLDPWVELDPISADSKLISQLDILSKQFSNAPLKIELWQVDPDSFDSEGILGNIDFLRRQMPIPPNTAEMKERLATQTGLEDIVGSAETDRHEHNSSET